MLDALGEGAPLAVALPTLGRMLRERIHRTRQGLLLRNLHRSCHLQAAAERVDVRALLCLLASLDHENGLLGPAAAAKPPLQLPPAGCCKPRSVCALLCCYACMTTCGLLCLPTTALCAGPLLCDLCRCHTSRCCKPLRSARLAGLSHGPNHLFSQQAVGVISSSAAAGTAGLSPMIAWLPVRAVSHTSLRARWAVRAAIVA